MWRTFTSGTHESRIFPQHEGGVENTSDSRLVQLGNWHIDCLEGRSSLFDINLVELLQPIIRSPLDSQIFMMVSSRGIGVAHDSQPDTPVDVGDEVHIIAGCRFPAILRPYREDSPLVLEAASGTCKQTRLKSQLFRVGAVCYIDGWMSGEMVSGSAHAGAIYLL